MNISYQVIKVIRAYAELGISVQFRNTWLNSIGTRAQSREVTYGSFIVRQVLTDYAISSASLELFVVPVSPPQLTLPTIHH